MKGLASRLAGPHGVEAFDAEHREQRAVIFQGALTPEEAGGLFDIGRLQAALSGPGAPESHTDISRIDRLLHLSDALKGSKFTPVDGAAEFLRMGATLRFRDIDQFDTELAGFAKEVAETYAADAQINVYLTPANQRGFPAHFDNSDAFILQVSGSKDWLIFSDYSDKQVLPGPDVDWDPARFRPADTAKPVTLKAGDVLYLPRGVMHAAKCTDEESMHLTVTLTPLTMLSVLQRELKRFAAEEIELRRRVVWSVDGGVQEAKAIRREARKLLGAFAEKVDPSSAIEEKRSLLAQSSPEQANLLRDAVASNRR